MRPQVAAIAIERQRLGARIATRDRGNPCEAAADVVERVGKYSAGRLETDEEQAGAVPGVERRIVGSPGGCIEERVRNEEAVGDPVDCFEPEVRAEDRQIARQVPFMRRDELAAGLVPSSAA